MCRTYYSPFACSIDPVNRMPISKEKAPFIIRVRIGDVIAQIDLSTPALEKQVLAAAGRFNALRRKKHAGGKPPKPITCGLCKVEYPSLNAFKAHTCGERLDSKS